MIGPRLVDKTLVLYGCGKLGHLADEIFKELNIFIYSHIDMKGPTTPNDFPISIRGECLVAICVASDSYMNICNNLKNNGFIDIVPVWDIIEAYPEMGIHNGWFAGETSEKDEEGVLHIMDHLMDKTSILHYLQFRHWSIAREEWASVNYPPEIGKEPLPSTLADIRQRQRVITFADTPLIRAVCIHAEGCELKALEVNMHIFQKYRPSIECACYHSRDGLWKIEKFLIGNLPDYRWTFRLHSYMGQGAYICGMPKERL